MQIIVSYDQPQNTLPAGFVNDVNYVVNLYDNLFASRNVTLNIHVGYGELQQYYVNGGTSPTSESVTNGGGESSAAGIHLSSPITWDTVIGALENMNAPGAYYAALSPLITSRTLNLTSAEAKALGFNASPYNVTPYTSDGFDGSVGFDSTVNWSYAINTAPAAGQAYFVGVVEHEISEVMGRFSSLGNQNDGTSTTLATPLDLFRFQGEGHWQTSITGSAYFSVDDGRTPLDYYNNWGSTGDTGDPTLGDLADWANNTPSGTPTPADAFRDRGGSNPFNVLSPADIIEMDALGWGSPNVAQALTVYNLDPVTKSLYVWDTSANVSASLDQLQSAAQSGTIGKIGLTDLQPLQVSVPQLTADASALGLVAAGSYDIGVSVGGFFLQIDLNGDSVTYRLPSNVGTFTDTDKGSSGGNANITGNSHNYALYWGLASDYTVTHNANGSWNVVKPGGLGTDTITNFTDIVFRTLAVKKTSTIHIGTPAQDDLTGSGTSDILFRNDATGDTWFEAMSPQGQAPPVWNQIGGSETAYALVGVGVFYGNGTDDNLFRNNSSGDTWIEQISNGAFAGWSQIGGSNTTYSVVGVADFYGNGTDDILYRNNSTGDTWFEAISNGGHAGWDQIGGSDTNFSVVSTGDFYGNGTDDNLFRNNSSGDTWIEQISNGAFAGWSHVGGSDTHYSVVGVGDFFGNGTDDVLFRNNSSGDTWIEAISNGGFAGWQQVGGSDTNYSVVAVGRYFGNGTDDVLFRNNSTGDTWVEAISNGGFAGWSQIGGSNTSYTVKT